MPYLIGLLSQSGMHCGIPMVLFRDDLHLVDAHVGLSWVSFMCIQTLWSVSAGLCMPAFMSLFSALAAVVSHICRVVPQSLFPFLLEEPLSEITVCMVYIPSTSIGCKLVILFICLVLLLHVLKGLVMLLVSNHSEIPSGIL